MRRVEEMGVKYPEKHLILVSAELRSDSYSASMLSEVMTLSDLRQHRSRWKRGLFLFQLASFTVKTKADYMSGRILLEKKRGGQKTLV